MASVCIVARRYLVAEKGWNLNDLKRGNYDAIICWYLFLVSFPEKSDIVSSIALTISQDLKMEDIEVMFDYKENYKSGKSNYLMEIKTPAEVTWIEASPQTFNLKLVRKEDSR